MIPVKNKIIVQGYVEPEIPVDPPEGGLWETTFDHAYFGNKVLNGSGVQATNGQEVYSFVDQIGNVPIPWVGEHNPPLLSKAKPRYYNNLDGYTFLPNETDLRYRSASLGPYPAVCERWFVGVDSNYKMFEAYFKDTEYIGDRGAGGLRVRNGTEWPGDETHLTDLNTALNQVFLVRQRFYSQTPINIPEADSSTAYLMNCELWVNGVKEPKMMATFRMNDYRLGVGADTNNSHWGVIAIFYKNGAVSDADAATITSQLTAQYKVGQPLALPIAENLQIQQNGTNFTASYTFKGVGGVAEDVSKRVVKWAVSYFGINRTEYIPGTDGMMTFDSANFPLNTTDNNGDPITVYATQPDRGIRLEITVEDVQGRKFVIPQSILRDTEVVDIPEPEPGVDEDPFLATWDAGSRTSGEIPYVSDDVYFVDNYDENPGFVEFTDGATTPYYGDDSKVWADTTEVRVDLRKYRAKVTHLRVFWRNGFDAPTIHYVKKGEFQKTFLTKVSGTGWQTVNLPEATDVVAIVMTALRGDFFSEVEIHGSYITPTVVSYPVRKTPFRNSTWTNAFVWDVVAGFQDIGYGQGSPGAIERRTDLLSQHGGIRHYADRDHFEPAKGDYYFQPGFNGKGSWDYDKMYEGLKAAGIDVRVAIKITPEWIRNTWPEELRHSEQMPVEWAGSKEATLAAAYLPESYLSEGKLMFQFAARYGSVVVPDNLLSVHTEPGGGFPNNIKRSGLNVVNKMEISNEPDSWWNGWGNFMNGGQLAARMSASYDGHKGALGPGVGVKAADPNMDLSFPGIAGASISIYQAAIDWCREHRGYKQDGSVDVPWDTINYHQYSNDGGSIQYGTAATRGMAPEVSNFPAKMDYMIKFSNEVLGGMPIVLGEHGYDISQFGKQRAARLTDLGNEVPDKTVRKLVQAQWLLRTALLGWIKGLEETQLYLFYDVSDDEYTNYAQSGVVEAMNRRPSGFFFFQALNLIGDYLVDQLISTTPYVIRTQAIGANRFFVIYSATESEIFGNYVLTVPNNATAVVMYTLNIDSEVPTSQALVPVNNQVTIPYSETPTFVKVTT